MKYLKFALLCLFVAVFASCQKEVDPSLNEPGEIKNIFQK